MQPPFTKWYDVNAQCKYHTGITGHSIENYTAFKKLIERFIKIGIVRKYVTQSFKSREELPKEARSYYEFNAEEGHEIQESAEFKTLLKNLIDNKELEFLKRSKAWKECWEI
ncbi:hypothetical protein GOBAR_DD28665 [Gossypium barbadense]|nr:hypothetical protein GOBAR_DD28665 [Gossypium barbadense]